MTINRRSFIKLTGTTILSTCAGALGISACSSWRDLVEVPSAPEGSYRLDGERIILSLPKVGSLTASGSAVRLVLEVGEGIPERLIVIRSGDGIYHALVDHCTHNDKELYYMHEGEMLRCHSGKSYFDIQGNVMEGPAEVPLRVFPIRQEADQLIIAMKSGGE